MSDNWYSESEWYTPDKKTVREKVKEKKKKGWTRTRIIGLAALVLALLVGSSVIFSQGRQEETATGGDFAFDYDGDVPAENEEMPRNWKDFFEDYYQSAISDVAEVDIPRYEGSGKVNATTVSAAEQELTMQEIYAKCADSIVAISAYEENSAGYSWGTGIILSEDGFILTNTHVLEGSDSAVVTLYDDREYDAQLVGADGISDVALLKIDAKGLPAAEMGDSSVLMAGDEVVAIGNPLGETFRLTMTNGIISAIDRGINYNGHSMTLMQTNAALNEGNSGGALFNMSGQVIGVTNMKMMSSYSSIEGIGFAIPSATACQVVNELMANGEVRGRTSIGITVGSIPSEVADYYDELEGVSGLYVSAVSEGSDAEAKGVKPGDIICAVDGVSVTTTDEVNEMKNGRSVGDTMRLTIWRDGETFDIDVMLMDTNDIY